MTPLQRLALIAFLTQMFSALSLRIHHKRVDYPLVRVAFLVLTTVVFVLE